jgi:hypothetical protein
MLAELVARGQAMPRDHVSQGRRRRHVRDQERMSMTARRCRLRINWREVSSIR